MKKVSTILSFIAIWGILWLITSGAMAQSGEAKTGKIAGKIVDASDGEPLIGCNVVLQGTRYGAASDLNGNFFVTNVPEGTYTVVFSYISYVKKSIHPVTVTAGLTYNLQISLEPEGIMGESIVVEAKADMAAKSALLVQQKKAVVVSDAIGSEQISKTPDKSAGDALKRVTGLTVVGNKYVYVRGLGERYSNAQLNGIEIPSPEPEKKIIPMDIFPSGSIQNITVVKTYNPDMSGDFSGGLVQINTKEFPESFYMAASVSSGINNASFSKIPRYKGGGTDFLGFDDGTRKRPNIPKFNSSASDNLKAQYNSQFQDVWSPLNSQVSANSGFSFSVGNSLGEKSNIGFLGSLTYSSDFNTRNEKEFFPIADGVPAFDYKTTKGNYSVLWGTLLDVNVKLNGNNKIGLKTVYNIQSDDEASTTSGYKNGSSGGDVRFTRLRYQQRGLFSTQLLGEHQINDFLKSKIDWHVAYSQADRSEPDTRQTSYVLNETLNRYDAFGSSNNSRFFSDLTDQEVNTGVDWSIPVEMIKNSKIKFGSLVRIKNRDFNAHRYAYSNFADAVRGEQPEALFSSDNIANGLVDFSDDTQANDTYTAKENTTAGYVMADLPLEKKWRFIGGVRYENVRTELNSFNPAAVSENKNLSPKYTNNDFFPALNVVYALSERMNMRLGYSKTISRPQFRELAPFRYDDYRRSTYGNPFLKPSHIQNYDLRWEFFPNSGELVAASFFYKSFANPIEKFLLPNPGSQTGDPVPVNGGDGSNIGVEFDLRASMMHIAETLKDFSVTANMSLIRSRLTQKNAIEVYTLGSDGPTYFSSDFVANKKRPMQGQSPYVINIGLNYANPVSQTDANLAYNVFGARIAEISSKLNDAQGNKIYDDVYEQPFHQLDLTVGQKITKNIKIKANWKNILDQKVQFKMGNFITDEYKPGMSFSTSVTYDF